MVSEGFGFHLRWPAWGSVIGSGLGGSRCGGMQASNLRKGVVVDLRNGATVQASRCPPAVAIADVSVNASCKGVVCDDGCLAASGVWFAQLGDCYCSPGAFAEVAQTSRGPSLLALAPSIVAEHFVGQCQQVLDARDNGRAVPAFDGVSDALEDLRQTVSPHRRDMGWYKPRYCGVSAWEPCWSCALIHVRGVRGRSSNKVLGRVLHGGRGSCHRSHRCVGISVCISIGVG